MRRSRLFWLAVPLSVATLVAPSGGNAAPRVSTTALDLLRPGFQGEDSLEPGDLDNRLGRVAPTATQRAHARRLNANVNWSKFGTPQSVFNRQGYLAEARAGDPVAIARTWLKDNAGLFRLTRAQLDAADLELIANNPLYDAPDNRRRLAGLKPLAADDTLPHVVMFRQVFDGVEAGNDGLVTVALDAENRVTYVSSSLTADTRITNRKKLGPAAAWRAAAADVGWHVPLQDIEVLGKAHPPKFTGLKVPGVSTTQLTRLVALPTPRDGVRLAWESNTLDNDRVATGAHEPLAYITHVDAQTGKILRRQHTVFHLAQGVRAPMQVPDPRWKAFPNTPQLAVNGVASPDDREMWCWSVAATDCDRVIGGAEGVRSIPQLKFAYDELPADDNVGSPTFTSQGNNAWTTSSYASHLTPDSPKSSTPSPTRQYTYAFTDQWHTSNCNLSGNYASTQMNDIDAAINNLFVNYGRMHDWSYYLGFTESTWNMQQVNFGEDTDTSDEAEGGDPEKGQAQAGAVAGSVVFTGRDNANQITQQDGVPGITNQYLWHPLQASFYSPCVDGAYDMGVIAHEYGHAISNRMIGGPNAGIGGSEGPKMGEAWSDLMAMEYVNGYGFAPVGDENPFAVGPYATGNKHSGIRNYGMNDSPLNYSQMFYDGNGQTSPHSDSEIWSASNFTVRQALVEKYDKQFPYDNKVLQYQCADGVKPIAQCPGNRRWIQAMFDGFLIQAAAAGMPEAAEAQIASNITRFGKVNNDAKEMWAAYASRGLGDKADEGATPDWSTPLDNNEATVRFRTVEVGSGGTPTDAFIFVGPFSARTTEATIAKRGEESPIREFVPGKYLFTARADGYGMYQWEQTFEPRRSYLVDVPMRRNVASETNGAEASGDGGNHSALIDDSEETNWAFLGATTAENIEGKQVTVDLEGEQAHDVKEVAISALNRPQANNDPYDAIGQNRFAALRSFEIYACDATSGADCEEDDSFQLIYTSPEDAFPSGRPRPTSENLRIKTFDVTDAKATHIRLKVLTNQCTGNPLFTVEENPVGEPLSNPDCVNGFTFATLVSTDIPDPDNLPQPNNTQKHRVRASELQVFTAVTPGSAQPPVPPVVVPPKQPTGPRHPATGAGPALPIAALVLATAAAVALRKRNATV